jgi:hypothetical protein
MESTNNDIINWILLDEKIKKYNARCTELKLLKNDYHDKIIDNLSDKNQEFIIENKNMKIYVAKNNKYSSFTDKFLLETFNEFFNDTKQSECLLKFMKSKRTFEEKYVLKTKILNL